MTEVTRTVRRLTSAMRYSRGKNRRVVVSLEPPGDRIGFRLAKERRTYYLPVGELYAAAVRAHLEAERDRKKQARKLKKGATR